MSDQPKNKKGELRRRWRQMLDDGSIARLRSEGRLAALYVLYAADWSTCEVRLSMRRSAKLLGVQPTTIRRGISQLIEAGIMKKVGSPEKRSVCTFVVLERARAVSTLDTSGAQGCAQPVSTLDTPGAQTGHTPCAPCARPVRRLRTLCAHNTVLSTGSQSRTSGGSGEASPSGGVEPPSACPEGEKKETEDT
jgi:hypothetical protein